METTEFYPTVKIREHDTPVKHRFPMPYGLRMWLAMAAFRVFQLLLAVRPASPGQVYRGTPVNDVTILPLSSATPASTPASPQVAPLTPDEG